MVNTGALDIQKSQKATVTPFEKLELSLSGNQVSGEVKYAEKGTKYVLRTYFAEKEGGADYLIDEQINVDPNSISVDIPDRSTHAPSGEYYVTSFLMTEKTTTVADENGESENVAALMAIDSWQSKDKVHYTNSNQPAAPANVTLTFVGNEVMRAEWEEVSNVDGYRVTVYQKKDGKWEATGSGYDLKKSKDGQLDNSINMALTVGGEETENSKNLSANETYMVGVSAYKRSRTSRRARRLAPWKARRQALRRAQRAVPPGAGEPAPQRRSPRSITAKKRSLPTMECSCQSTRN